MLAPDPATPAARRVLCLLVWVLVCGSSLRASPATAGELPGIDELPPFAPFLGGAFPNSTPGGSDVQTLPVSANLDVGMLLVVTEGSGVLYVGSRDGRIIKIAPAPTSEQGLLFRLCSWC